MPVFLKRNRFLTDACAFPGHFLTRHAVSILKVFTSLIMCASAVAAAPSYAQQSADLIPNYPEIKVSKRGKETPSNGVKLSNDNGLDGAIVGIVLSSKHTVEAVPNTNGAKRPRVLVHIPANLKSNEICMQVRSRTDIYGVAHEYFVPDKYASTTVELEYPTNETDFLRRSSVETIAIRLTQGSCNVPPAFVDGKPHAHFLVPAWNVDQFKADDDILVLVQGGSMLVDIASGPLNESEFKRCEKISAGNNPLFNHICRIRRNTYDNYNLHHIDFVTNDKVAFTLSFTIFETRTREEMQ